MTKTGQMASKLERKDGRWWFSIGQIRENGAYNGIECRSTLVFETDHPYIRLEIEPLDEVEVSGDLKPYGQFYFDDVRVLKRAEQTVNH
jgi:hypothetical protein